MRAMIGLTVLLAVPFGVVVGVPAALAVEQTVTPLSPPEEQHVAGVGAGGEQRVGAVEAEASQQVGTYEPPSPAQKTASKVGKAVFGVLAAAVALASAAAMLIFL